MGRLHCVAHLGAMLGADPDWIRETQRQVLEAEEWKVDKVAERVQRLAVDFPVDAGLGALTTMRNELNATDEGVATTKGLADRMVDVSGGLSPQVGDWVKALAARKNEPGSWLLKAARWLSEPARYSLWHRLVKNADSNPRPGRCSSSSGCRWRWSVRVSCSWSWRASSTPPRCGSSRRRWPG